MDRAFMTIDAQGNARTLRETPELLRIQAVMENGVLQLHAAGHAPYPLEPPGQGALTVATLFEDRVEVTRSLEGSRWLSSVLGFEASLVSRARTFSRRPSGRFPDMEVDLVDVYPVTCVSTASLDALAARGLPHEGLLERFRPNLVFDTSEAFWEDTAGTFRVGTTTLSFGKRTSRCMVINVDPKSGRSAPETLRKLAAFRTEENNTYFASNYLVTVPGTLHVGDTTTS